VKHYRVYSDFEVVFDLLSHILLSVLLVLALPKMVQTVSDLLARRKS
jgi:hypothetical protein